jgi:hypothetical protein
MANSIRIEVGGRWYTGKWYLTNGNEKVVVSHNQVHKWDDIGLAAPEVMARQMLHDIVVRDKHGVPDPQDDPAG